MSFVAVAIGGAAVVGAVGATVAGHQQAVGQEQAARTQANTQNQIEQINDPFVQSGYGAENTLNYLTGGGTVGGVSNGVQQPDAATVGSSMGLPAGYLTQQFNPTQDQLNNYPGYQFALKTGGQATRNADTPGVGSLSGAALKDLTNFNVGTANQYYGQYFNQFQTQQNNIFNRLSQIAGIGQGAASGVSNNVSALGQGIAGAQAGAAASTAGGIVGATNAVGNSASTVGLYNLINGGNNGFTLNNSGASYVDPASTGYNNSSGVSEILGGGN